MVWYVSVSGASHSLMPGPACPNARPGQCPDCRAQTRGAQQHYAHHLCSVQSRQWEGWQLSVTLGSVIIQLRVSCKSDQEWIKLARLSNEVTIPLVPTHYLLCYGSLQSPAELGQCLGSRPARLTRPKLHQIRLQISAQSWAHCQPSQPGLWSSVTPGGLRHIYINSQESGVRGEQGWGVFSTPRPCPAFLNVPMMLWSLLME